MEPKRYRLIQDGIVVAQCDGDRAWQEINHYATVYGQDGPVQIEKRHHGRWYAVENTHVE